MQRVEANHDHEQTGYKGCLPDTGYNLHCPCMGGPEYKFNYTSISCAARLEKKTCKETGCSRFKGEAPGFREFQFNCGAGADRHEVRIECTSCHNIAINHGRGLCRTCHKKHTKAGTIGQFKRKRHDPQG